MKKQFFQNKNTNQYYKQVHKTFPILSQQEKRFLHFFKHCLKNYEMNHPDLQYQDYIEQFGQPEVIISSYYEHIESDFIIHHMQSRKFLKRSLIILITLALCVSTYIIYTYYRAFHEFQNSQIYSEQTIIEDYGNIEVE